jgi:hypothetical protein
MPIDRKRTVPAAAAMAIAFAAAWFLLDRTEDRPRWAIVEATSAAIVGEPYEVRVTLAKSVEPTMISCTLHRANDERRGWGFLASSGPSRPAAGGGTYDFVFDVPNKAETAYVFALVFLSPSGEWKDGTRAVATELVPIDPAAAGEAGRRLKRVAVRTYPTAARTAARRAAAAAAPRAERHPPAWVHPVLAALLLAAAWGAARAGRAGPWRRPESSGERTIWLLFAAVLAACAFIEVSGFASAVAAFGRQWARGAQIYDVRRPLQKFIMAGLATASLGLFFLFIGAVRRPAARRDLWWAGIGLADYLVLSFAGVLSFHAVDVARSVTLAGLPPYDALRGAGALTALLAGLAAARRGGPLGPT